MEFTIKPFGLELHKILQYKSPEFFNTNGNKKIHCLNLYSSVYSPKHSPVSITKKVTMDIHTDSAESLAIFLYELYVINCSVAKLCTTEITRSVPAGSLKSSKLVRANDSHPNESCNCHVFTYQ
ncbi:hypothetical protein NQ317_019495 [Molorchus minor]|uniref:Uncharacterized protein n=1 Tax=Molorchus minor TaxID=1323400 RepID=A0ABQ9JB15_9CUCU|nr:hypothetical protein NQ317_019495 [Molorchus minor]